MTRDMAKTLCQHFLEAHLIESAIDPANRSSFKDKGLWQVTPKGLCILEDFCSRTIVDVKHLRAPMARILPIKVIMLERHTDDDQLALNRRNVVVLFKIMMGSLTFEESIASSEYYIAENKKNTNDKNTETVPFSILQPASDEDIGDGGNRILTGSKLLTTNVSRHRATIKQHQLYLEKYGTMLRGANRRHFNGQICCDWLLDHTTVVSKKEAEVIASQFLRYSWIETAAEKTQIRSRDDTKPFKSSKSCIYSLTDNGRTVISWEQELNTSDFSSTDGQSIMSGEDQSTMVQKAKDQALRLLTGIRRDNINGNIGVDEEASLREMLAADPIEEKRGASSDERAYQNDLLVADYNNSQNGRSKQQPTLLHRSASKSSSSASGGSESVVKTPTEQDTNAVGYISKENEARGAAAQAMAYSRPRPPSTIDSRGSNFSIYSYNSSQSSQDSKESNTTKLRQILDDPNLRSLFKSFLRANFCEENLDFWIDHSNLRRKYRIQSPALTSRNQSDLLEDAYALYTTYLAAGSPNELNIEHSLRNEMARFVTNIVTILPSYTPGAKSSIVISPHSASHSLRTMMKMLQKVDDHICKLMAADSVPKFIRTKGYLKIASGKETNPSYRGSKLNAGDLEGDEFEEADLEESVEKLDIATPSDVSITRPPITSAMQ
ncbi:hypothetical protein NQZ79_g1208 [Umbelopsis isabellina]|nr:hypothetical protein NQZ79_g1208 [Umbelopsis isabellina]